MNLVSAVVGLSIMGIAAPTVLEMSITPIIAQKRASNFGNAESAAVVYAAQNEGKVQVAPAPNNCNLDINNAPAYEITCWHGHKKFKQTVSRSFLGATNTNAGSARFNYPKPPNGYAQPARPCHAYENWGINTSAYDSNTNTWVSKPCMPNLIWMSKNQPDNLTNDFHRSNIDNWVYDINGFNGLNHKDY